MLATLLRLLALLSCLLLAAPALDAQVPGVTPPAGGETSQPSAEAEVQVQERARTLAELVATIEDPERREKLLNQLRALLDAQRAAAATEAEEVPSGLVGSLMGFLADLSAEVRGTVNGLLQQASLLPERWRRFQALMRDDERRAAFLWDLLRVSAVTAGALLVGALVFFALRRLRGRAMQTHAGHHYRWLTILMRHVLIGALRALPAAVMVAAGFLGISLAGASPQARLVTLAILWAIAIYHWTKIVIELLTMPKEPRLRLVRLSDERAVRLARSLRGIAALGVFGYFALVVLIALGADREQVVRPLGRIYGLLLLGSLIAFVLRQRAPVREWLARKETAEPLPALADEDARLAHEEREKRSARRSILFSIASLWWLAAIAYLLGIFMVWASATPGGFGFVLQASALTVLSVAGAAVAMTVVHRLLDLARAEASRRVSAYPALQRVVPRYVAGLRTVLDWAILILAFCFALEAWGLAALDLFARQGVQDFLAAVIGILLTILIAAAAIDVATVATQRYLELRERAGKATAKVKTLVPLVRTTLKVIVVVVAVVTILGQVGIQVGPLLAGVGIVGLAIGFGAQTLVKDVITGFFILLEDQVNVGDVAQVDGTGGQVEAINLRTIALRDLSGNVHTIPFSSVTKVTNMTKDFSRYVVECGVAYREDPDDVIAVLKQLGAELQADPDFGRDMIAPIEILGVERLADSAVVIRARLTTKPIQQWRVGREFLRRMKKRFDELGIEIPFPHQTVYWGVDKQGRAPPLRLLEVGARVGAAGTAAERNDGDDPDRSDPDRSDGAGGGAGTGTGTGAGTGGAGGDRKGQAGGPAAQ